ncbi:hypothetical protein D3C87_1273930 [compost metagenome]
MNIVRTHTANTPQQAHNTNQSLLFSIRLSLSKINQYNRYHNLSSEDSLPNTRRSLKCSNFGYGRNYGNAWTFGRMLSPDFLINIPMRYGNPKTKAYASDVAFFQKACRRTRSLLQFQGYIIIFTVSTEDAHSSGSKSP